MAAKGTTPDPPPYGFFTEQKIGRQERFRNAGERREKERRNKNVIFLGSIECFG
jgi:hypothetical protein